MANPLAQALMLPSQRDQRLLDRVQYGQGILQDATSGGPVQHWGQGVARMLKAGLGGYFAGSARKEGEERDRVYQNKLAEALRSPDPMGALGQSDDPDLQGIATQYQLSQAMEPAAERWTTLTDQQELDMGLPPEGVYQQSTAGGVKSVYDAPKVDKFKPQVEEFFVDGKRVKGYLDENDQLVTVGDKVPLYKEGDAGIQITGYDEQGRPIISIGGPGGAVGGKPTESNAQALFRGTLLGQAMDEIQAVADSGFANISPGRMATAEFAGQYGPLGRFAGEKLKSDEEKKYQAAIAKGTESLVAAITGAGVAVEQFPRIQQNIPLPTDNPDMVRYKLTQLQNELRALKISAGPLAPALTQGQGAGGPPPAGPAPGGDVIRYDAAGKRIP